MIRGIDRAFRHIGATVCCAVLAAVLAKDQPHNRWPGGDASTTSREPSAAVEEPSGGVTVVSPAPGRGVGLAAAPLQERLHATARLVGIPLIGSEPDGVEVLTVQLVSPFFETVAPRTFGQRLRAGSRVDFAVPYGAARCPRVSAATVVVAGYRDPGGSERTVRLTAPAGVLTRLHRAECDERELQRAFSVEWSPSWERIAGRPARLRGELILRRTLDRGVDVGPVEIVAVTGSVLYDLTAERAASVQLGSDPVVMPVEIGVRMCFSHGLIEAKKVFVFTLSARLGGGPTLHRTIEPPARIQDLARALLASCPPE